jgi:RNA polymerase sigma-70 factor (ECF subfamily)
MLLTEAYRSLSPDEIFLIDQYYREEASVDELTEMTGLSASNVKVRLFRARQKMHQAISSVLKEEIEIWQPR